MSKHTRKHLLAIAPFAPFALSLALGIAPTIGCGNPDANASASGVQPGPGPGPAVDPPQPDRTIDYPPVVGYGLFDPKTEDELKATITEGSMAGNPIVNYGYMVAKVRPSFNPAKFGEYGLEVKASMSAGGAKYYFLHKESDLVETMNKVRRELGGLMYIEPDMPHYTTADPVPFNWDNPDPLVANLQQYGVLVTETLKAWQTYGFGPNRAVVGTIDTGVNFNHEDMDKTVRHAYTWWGTGGTTLSVTASPYADPEPMDFRTANPTAATGTDSNAQSYHGTHTAGTMAAEGGNGRGVAGMCWSVDMVNYKGFSNSGSNNLWSTYGSLWHLVKWKKANNYNYTIPVNMSFGSPLPSQFGADMVELALENDILCVASSGNDGSGFQTWPGGYTGVMRVGATDFRDRRVWNSNWGANMSVVAPGFDVLSTDGATAAGTRRISGTSMAAPHVTGLVGYMLTFAPDLKPDQIRTYIEQNTDPVEGQTGFSVRTGWGRINTYRTIGAVITDKASNNAPPSNYSMSPVKIIVENVAHQPMYGVPVYLYNCDQSGAMANYANCTLSGTSYFDVRDDLEADVEEGVARFNSLKPGYYRAAATPVVMDINAGLAVGAAVSVSKATPVFEVRSGVTVPEMKLTIDGFNPLFIQTMPTNNTTRQATDTKLAIYNSQTAAALYESDCDSFDTMICKMPTAPGTYFIRVYPTATTGYGEYALWLSGTEIKPYLMVAPGTYANAGQAGTDGADGIRATPSTSRSATTQLIEIGSGKLVYGDLTSTTGHYYRFVIP